MISNFVAASLQHLTTRVGCLTQTLGHKWFMRGMYAFPPPEFQKRHKQKNISNISYPGATGVSANRLFPSSLSLSFKASLSAKSLLCISVLIHIEIRANYRGKNFVLSLALKERLRGTRK